MHHRGSGSLAEAPNSTPGDQTPRPRGWKVFGAAWVALAVLCGLWAIATPISAAPDEPAHLIKAASVVRGEFIGTPSDKGHIVQVPQYIAWTHAVTCFAFDANETANCDIEPPLDSAAIVPATTTAGLYNPIYYAVVGWPSLLFGSDAGIYAMRIVSGVFTSLFLALSFMMVSSWRRAQLPTLALAIITTPMLLFLSGTVNPNGIETTATLAVFVAMLSIVREPSQSLLAQRSVVLVVASLAAVNSRGLSPIWLAVALIAPLFLLSWPQLRALLTKRAVIAAIVGVALATTFALAWLLGTSSLTAAIGDTAAPVVPGTGSPALYGFITTLLSTFEYGASLIGLFGWLDTAAPVGVQFLWAALIGGLLFLALTFLRRREFWVFLSIAAAFVLLPAIIQGAYVTGGGYIWQGRYNFPLFACLMMAAGTFAATHVPRISDRSFSRAITVLVMSMSLAQLYSFIVVLRRYVVGADQSWLDFVRAPEWMPPGGTLVVVALYVLAMAGTSYLLARELKRARARESAIASSVA